MLVADTEHWLSIVLTWSQKQSIQFCLCLIVECTTKGFTCDSARYFSNVWFSKQRHSFHCQMIMRPSGFKPWPQWSSTRLNAVFCLTIVVEYRAETQSRQVFGVFFFFLAIFMPLSKTSERNPGKWEGLLPPRCYSFPGVQIPGQPRIRQLHRQSVRKNNNKWQQVKSA